MKNIALHKELHKHIASLEANISSGGLARVSACPMASGPP
jgi:hypothetical protein